ncbi:hypothetical protein [Deinococcus misasensis]|uniref:hypothetical protein n=1 Tax=Deinococcus misasensis TaxID=392413 RepID=UPI000550BFFF|nr:hypothetical protein [Deinococcus misasensis]
MITTDQLVEALQKYPAGTPLVIPGALQNRTVLQEDGEEAALQLITFQYLQTADLPWIRVLPESEAFPGSESDLLIMIEKDAEGVGKPVVILPVKSIQVGGTAGCSICENPPSSDT